MSIRKRSRGMPNGLVTPAMAAAPGMDQILLIGR
jgi:hypothetical protein